MVGLVGVTGLAGSGKTTAVDRLSQVATGRVLYLGRTVLEAVRSSRLPVTRDSERQVRIDLRRENGPAALALPYVDEVSQCIENGIPIFVDAIFTWEEFNVLASRVPDGSARLLEIQASFDIRCARLACRPERPFNADELRERDKTELERLGTAAVMGAAKYKICNEGTFDEFYRRLAEFVCSCG